MVDIAGHYDEQAEPSSFDPVPAGDYRAKLIESDIEDVSSRDNKGRCLKLTWQIETGPHDGRLVWQRLNMWAENMNNLEKVITIANSQFAAIRTATGKMAPRNTEELHHIPCTITVAVRIDPNGVYAPQNEIKNVKAAAGGANVPQKSSGPRSNSSPAPSSNRGPGPSSQRSAPWPARGQSRQNEDQDIPF